jgi:hypothetical protein
MFVVVSLLHLSPHVGLVDDATRDIVRLKKTRPRGPAVGWTHTFTAEIETRAVQPIQAGTFWNLASRQDGGCGEIAVTAPARTSTLRTESGEHARFALLRICSSKFID